MHRQLAVFSGGASGLWRVLEMKKLCGPELARVPFVDLSDGGDPALKNSVWRLEGMSSHLRYTYADEATELSEKSLPLSGKSQRGSPDTDW